MHFDMTSLSAQINYKLLTATVVPRPIAWVTTRSATGINNAAPYSFFNVMGHEPPTVAIGILRHPERGHKDTAQNILSQKEFVVHLVSAQLARAMRETSASLPPEEDELRHAKIEVTEADIVRASRIVKAPVAFECISTHCIETGPEQFVVVGKVLRAHIADRFVMDAARGYIDTPALDLISRMHGSGWYGKFPELMELERPQSARMDAASK